MEGVSVLLHCRRTASSSGEGSPLDSVSADLGGLLLADWSLSTSCDLAVELGDLSSGSALALTASKDSALGNLANTGALLGGSVFAFFLRRGGGIGGMGLFSTLLE